MTKAGTTKGNASKRSFLGKSQKNKAKINAYENILALQQKRLSNLRRRVHWHYKKLKEVEALEDQLQDKISLAMRPSTIKRRLANPTSKTSKKYSKNKKRKETFGIAEVIHGGSGDDEDPVLFWLLDTISAKFHVQTLAKKLFKFRPKLTRVALS